MGNDPLPEDVLAQLDAVLEERYGTNSADVHPQLLADCRKLIRLLPADPWPKAAP